MVDLEEKLCTGHTYVVYEDHEVGLSSLDFHCVTPEDYAFCPPPLSLFQEFRVMDNISWNTWCEEYEPSDDEILVSELELT
jgi:hypothetical protein